VVADERARRLSEPDYAVALGWYFAASLLRLTRSSMLGVLRSEHVKLARLKGLPGYVALDVHAFNKARNSSAGKRASGVTFWVT
jgi:hypothetical protein